MRTVIDTFLNTIHENRESIGLQDFEYTCEEHIRTFGLNRFSDYMLSFESEGKKKNVPIEVKSLCVGEHTVDHLP